MKKFKVNQNTCLGCGACVAVTNDETFTFDDDGKAVAVEGKCEVENMTEEQVKNAQSALEGCPVEAIALVEE